MRFPVKTDRGGWTGDEVRNRRGVVCPVEPTFANTFGAARGGGDRSHQGIDIFAGLGTAVVAPEAGAVSTFEGELSGRGIRVDTASGRRWSFTHLRSVQPFTNGQRVEEGTLLGTVGQSGDAASTCPHVHVELRQNGELQNPFDVLERIHGEEGQRSREVDERSVLALGQALLEVAEEWRRSGIERAIRTADQLERTVADAYAVAQQGRPDAALELLETAARVTLRAPEEWTHDDSVLNRLTRTLREARETGVTAISAAAGGASMGILLGAGAVVALLALSR